MSPLLPLVAFLAILSGCGAEVPLDTGPPAPDDLDGDGYNVTVDCDDGDPAIHPDADETCNGIDDDCDSVVDDDATDAGTWYDDVDLDGYGDPATAVEACDSPGGIGDGTDCDDGRADVFPGNPETCDDVDNDCDGQVDEDAANASVFWTDADGDGYGDAAGPVVACDPPEGTATNDDDCDDADPAIHPGATETCNEKDDDCDTRVDEGATRTIYQDADADGWGASEVTAEACEAGPGWSVFPGDCDDGDETIHPWADESCDDVDQDCDGEVDEDPVDGTTWYADTDGDGHGGTDTTTEACALPSGYTAEATDCDDADPAIHPDASEWCDGIDNDCDGRVDDDVVTGEWYADADGDGYGDPDTSTEDCAPPDGWVADATDCDDADADAFPGNPETCDGADNDCDGEVDEGFSSTCEDLLCSGEGLLWEISDACLDDGGSSSGGDSLEVYCYWEIARFCLSGEACQWRDGAPSSDDGTTCERSGLSSDYMANAWCELYEDHTEYNCDSDEQIYFE